MSWTFTYNLVDKKQIIEEITHNNNFLKKAIYGNRLWTLWLNPKTQQKEIILYLLGKRNGSWGYKNISETMHPIYYNCPQSFLKEAKATCTEWRNKVIEYHKQKESLKKIELGDIVKVRNCHPNEFVVVQTNPLLGRSVVDGKWYKLIKSRII